MRPDAETPDAGSREDADRAPLHTPEEWEAIARQAAQQAKQGTDARSGAFQKPSPYVIVFLLCGIAFALSALLLPEAFDRVFSQPQMEGRRSQEIWLKAHPVASFLYTALMVAASAALFWYRGKHSYRVTQQEIERLRVK